MTNNELIALYNSLKGLKSLKGVKFSYGVAKNLSLIETEIKAIEKSLEHTEKYNEYETARIALCTEHAKKENGQPVMKGNQFDIEDMEKFEKDFLKLREEHKEAIAERDTQIEEYNKLLKEENKIELYKINLKDVPEDITTEQMESIYKLITEE